MTDKTTDALTGLVHDSFGGTADPRLKHILERLTHHLHAFVNDVDLSYDEWEKAIDFLTRTGQKCDDVRQEFILLSDVLGVSMLVETLNDVETPDATDSTVLGPFHMIDSPARALGENISPQSDGQSCVVHGAILDAHGHPVPGAVVDVWQADAHGFYDVQQPGVQLRGNGRGLFTADDDGRFRFTSVVPSHYPIPTDGPVGELLAATSRHAYRPAHIHFIVTAPGYRELTTHIFVNNSQYLDSDAVFAVKDSLVRDFVPRPAGSDNPCGVTEDFVEAEIDIILHKESGDQL
ncbi:6-chlorohydroxyquinol-1,2-dioxygenase [Rhodococcus sp. 06-462-5]|uniref:dioxygenase family protein n=1 Tax=Nocardiaceae TaxID=85025 RepID=UPI00050CECAF|nr:MULTISPECIES: dioxygenase [Rhodococcus]OZC74006.1 6-chlorohydroxyquinol-1,2-dioxygenase [Rhodococcus sp. 06-462-5]OZE68002.1 6-chlorohydroxyquinol-1,2-dioxygenase [Rhodococcus sp. 02-925g]OZF51976.1 6-chlorohydroxyquinol-1,2-dioxygenase [Rhodococcus sp. 14-1411-2a]